jgi:preprotein translocase subunit YajC
MALSNVLALLQEQPVAAPASPFSSSLFPLVIVAILGFFLLILPDRKRQKQRQRMLEALKKGDRVVTSSGLHGTVVTATPEIVVLQAADNVRLRFSRVAVQTVLADETPVEQPEPSKA